MSKTLMPCVCGSYEDLDGEEHTSYPEHCYTYNQSPYYACSSPYCSATTPLYSTKEEAAAAWNTMQAALQAKWTDEPPTEEGAYWFVGQINLSCFKPRDIPKQTWTSPIIAIVDKFCDGFSVKIGNDCFVLDNRFVGKWQKVYRPGRAKE